MKRKVRRFWRQLTADKKKFGIFVSVVAVGLLLWGRLLFLEKVPKIATADPDAQKQSQKPENKADGKGSGEKNQPELARLDAVYVDLSTDLALDLFAFRHNRYKLLPPELTSGHGVQNVNPGDDEVQRRRMLEELRSSLSLQSVVWGPNPAAVVNGRIVRVGETIEGCKLLHVHERSATLKREGLEFTLTLEPE